MGSNPSAATSLACFLTTAKWERQVYPHRPKGDLKGLGRNSASWSELGPGIQVQGLVPALQELTAHRTAD